MSTTARVIVTAAARKLGALGTAQTLDDNNAESALQTLNWMLGQLGLQPQALAVRVREVFDMVADQGGPSNPYTIGDAGDFDTSRPATLQGAGLVLTQSQPDPVEIPLTLYTDDGYESIQVKDLSNSQPTGVWYQPTSPLGKIYLWPIPDVAYNDLALYWNAPFSAFTTLSTAYDLPPGAEEMLVYNLCPRMADEWGRPASDTIRQMATTSLRTFKNGNMRPNDVSQDIYNGNRAFGFNIQTGNM